MRSNRQCYPSNPSRQPLASQQMLAGARAIVEEIARYASELLAVVPRTAVEE